MEPKNWPDFTRGLGMELRSLRGGAPEVMKAFAAMAQSALAEGVLEPKIKELIAIAVSVATRCDDCIGFHIKAAVDRGATREEILETLGMAIYMGAGPSAMYASHALGAYTQFAAPKADAA
jgi:AhpD family alkylhydroperoxidase